jgi:hypothetical protein
MVCRNAPSLPGGSSRRVAPYGVVFQDLLDLDYMEQHYGMRLREFILAMAFATHVTKAFTVQPWFGSTVAIRVPRTQG